MASHEPYYQWQALTASLIECRGLWRRRRLRVQHPGPHTELSSRANALARFTPNRRLTSLRLQSPALWCRAENGAFSSGDRIPVPQQEITQSVAALVLAGGSSDNPLARARAMPALEIGKFWAACGWVLHVCDLLRRAGPLLPGCRLLHDMIGLVCRLQPPAD
jgi:hypothetical protein